MPAGKVYLSSNKDKLSKIWIDDLLELHVGGSVIFSYSVKPIVPGIVELDSAVINQMKGQDVTAQRCPWRGSWLFSYLSDCPKPIEDRAPFK